MKLPRGFSFSLSRASGIDVIKRRFSRQNRIRLNRAGRKRKLGPFLGAK